MNKPSDAVAERRIAMLHYMTETRSVSQIASELRITTNTVRSTLACFDRMGITINRVVMRDSGRWSSGLYRLDSPLSQACVAVFYGTPKRAPILKKEVVVKPAADKKVEQFSDKGALWFIITPDRRASYARIDEDRIARRAN